ncbi:MAG: hypothetical protein OEX13_13445 [Gammaproteobacteria bacterium]|nr:hypothetical protein [Gammaproteobacteria bacterium]
MMSAAEQAFVIIGTMVVLSLCLIAHRWRFHFLHMSVCAIVLGSIGMLIGARVDFGQFGLAIIADWCSVQPPVSLAGMRNQVALAPWTCVGMLAGCNLGMALSAQSLDQAAETRPALLLRFTACSVGMILGMLMAEPLLPGAEDGVAGVPAPIRMFLVMILGMTAGMWVGWWLAELALKQGTRWVVHAASRHAPHLRN